MLKYSKGQILKLSDIILLEDKEELGEDAVAVTGNLKILEVIEDGLQYPYIVEFENGYRMAMEEQEVKDITIYDKSNSLNENM